MSIQIFPNADEVAAAAAVIVLDRAKQAIAKNGTFSIALSGGSTPKKLYDILASPESREYIDWSLVHFFFSDERYVPSDDERSNFRLAEDALFSKLPTDHNKIHRVLTTLDSAEAAAEAYEHDMRSFFVAARNEAQRFDLILLGLGSDGHTASLFADKPALEETGRLVVGSAPGILPPPVDRITFTLPLIKQAHAVLFMAAGEDKAGAVRTVTSDLGFDPDAAASPAGRVRPESGELFWLVDEAAASYLRK
ncbi:6-phosphogluconolactonase [Candidatus Saccharibacteria bacterium]|nr:MAG: 6-phosphogluconolactonase [Candidatus Saccharibacteria bacterium]